MHLGNCPVQFHSSLQRPYEHVLNAIAIAIRDNPGEQGSHWLTENAAINTAVPIQDLNVWPPLNRRISRVAKRHYVGVCHIKPCMHYGFSVLRSVKSFFVISSLFRSFLSRGYHICQQCQRLTCTRFCQPPFKIQYLINVIWPRGNFIVAIYISLFYFLIFVGGKVIYPWICSPRERGYDMCPLVCIT